jgi:UDP-N-acetylglucosamine acyltransferase
MNNFIHHTAIIESTVKVGTGNYIGPYCHITGNTVIGDNNRFESYCSIGAPAEHKDYFYDKNGKLYIGNNNVIREFVTIHSGTTRPTQIEDNIIILNHSHIAHDVYIEKNVTISAGVTFAGHCYVMEGANVALGSLIHQFQVIGAYSMTGMGCVVTKTTPIEPAGIYIGAPARFLKKNKVGLERNNITDHDINALMDKYNELRNAN